MRVEFYSSCLISKGVKIALNLNFFKYYMHYFRKFILLLGFMLCFKANALRVDSFSLKNTEIHLSVRNFANKTIKGYVVHKVLFKKNTNMIRLDLKQMMVDSVKISSNKLNHTHIGESLNIDLGATFNIGDSMFLSIWYQGTPASDPSGWGGFYFSGDYAFNLGVGFAVYPHSYGRAWMPCVDEFPMKSSYEMFIETDTTHTAACNGVFVDVTNTGSSKIWHYRESVPLSAYLASVSVSRFHVIQSNFEGMKGDFPVMLHCKPSDSSNVKNSFADLHNAIRFFEESFGAQPYSKVGYNMVPFSSGAMEHAGNITYPALFANGSKDYEKLMAHELSHHWWGNQVTCREVGDMWLNEGWASYCEHLFTEKLRGKDAYKKSILENHLLVLRYAHITDGQVFSLINIPESHTYGTHVYKKGADVVHSLRGVLGDSLFFKLCKDYQNTYRLGNASSIDMQSVFTSNGGGAIADNFFEHFVFQKGFPHIIISKQIHSGNGPFKLKFFTYQKPRFKESVYEGLPIKVSFFRDRNHKIDKTIVVNSETDSFEVELPFKPVYVCIDYQEELSDAITDRTLITGNTGTFDLPETMCKVILNEIADTALIRVEHHWVGPEKYITTYPYMSNYRYVTVDGIWDDALKMDMEMIYDGRQGSTGGIGFLDHTLIFKTEDSLTLLYRAFPGDHWREWKDLQFTYGNKNDKQGRVLVKNAKKGDYVFAMKDISLNIDHTIIDGSNDFWKVIPNPGKGDTGIEFLYPEKVKAGKMVLMDINGKIVLSVDVDAGAQKVSFNTSALSDGIYMVRYQARGLYYFGKLMVRQ